ncbi:Aste57867_15588 [Aphanomyces stellatus]|uniref:Aste57867_15588 protein n=1 Tax=Aphanomyces stellatus TaxID=120398 RepID=A0A485L4H2_9STRA|nr:hypothetical protein As57867_015532 [Aphanomyces stellatus]VFT92390.1 Aste57867_15588 [Aphanomyces stellatus]
MDGGNLRNVLNSATRSEVKWKTKIHWSHDISRALNYLHSLKPQVLQCNLNSTNILLNEERTSCKLSGFSASVQPHPLQHELVSLGVNRYTAPEVFEGKIYDTSADIYSYGMILFELATHSIPFEKLQDEFGGPYSDAEVASKIATGELLPDFTPYCPKWLVELARQYLVVDPAARPSAREVTFAIEEALANAIATMDELVTHICTGEYREKEWPLWDGYVLCSNLIKNCRHPTFRVKNKNSPSDNLLAKLWISQSDLDYIDQIQYTVNAESKSFTEGVIRWIDFKAVEFDSFQCFVSIMANWSATCLELFPLISASHILRERCLTVIFNTLKYCHNMKFIHGNIALVNVAWFDSSSYKLINFDSATRIGEQMKKIYLSEYCPPEMVQVLLDPTSEPLLAHTTFDVWCAAVLTLKLYSINESLVEFEQLSESQILESVIASGFSFQRSLDAIPLAEWKKECLAKCLHVDPTLRGTMDDLEKCLRADEVYQNFQLNKCQQLRTQELEIATAQQEVCRISATNIDILRQLSLGSSTSAFLADFNGRNVIVKRLTHAVRFNEIDVSNFVSEIILHSKLVSPYVVCCIGVAWTTSADIMLVTEFMSYLEKYIAIIRLVATQIQLGTIYCMCPGTLHSLTSPVIHRNLNSSKILLNKYITICKLSGFGAFTVKRHIEPEPEPHYSKEHFYMAPEVLMGKNYDASTDIYSFGMILLEFVSHCIPCKHIYFESAGRKCLSEKNVFNVVVGGRPSNQ